MASTALTSLLLLGACASPPLVVERDQPELARIALPYLGDLRALGITRVISPGSGAMVRLETFYGAVYVRYPQQVAPFTFMLEVGPVGFRAAAPSVDSASAAAALAAILPVAFNETARNNAFQWLRANPWH